MKKSSKKENKKMKLNYRNIILTLLIILILISIHTLYTISLFKGIETPLRICAGLLIIDIFMIFAIIGLKLKKLRNIKIVTIFGVILLLYSGILMFADSKVSFIYNKISAMSNPHNTSNIHSTSIVVTKKSHFKNIDDAKKGTIGIINEEGNISTYELPKKIIQEDRKSVV